MKELLEKIKSLDKKILIGGGIACAVVLILVIALIVGGSSDKKEDEESSQGRTEMNSQSDTEEQSESLVPGTEENSEIETEIGTELETEIETEMGTEVEMETETEEDTEVSDGSTNNNNSNGNDGNKNEEEILGEGSKKQPYVEIPDNNMKVQTVSIPSGKALYYSIQRIGGLILTIEDADAYIITSNGTRYDAKNGKVSITVENALASDYVTLQIGNKGGSAKAFTLKFSNAYGSRQNPEVIAKIGQYKKSLAEGKETGYYYKYTAEKTGKLRFYLSATVDSEMTVTNNRNSATRTFEADGLTDEQGRQYIELEVSQGDSIMIHVSAIPNRRGKYPATDITWESVYK